MNRSFLPLIWLLFLPFLALADRQDLSNSLAKIALNIPTKNYSISVVEVGKGIELYGAQSASPVKPASTLKIVTTGFALKTLGVAYRFETKAYVVKSGDKLDLYIQGGGDPSFTIESAMVLARTLARRGVKKIRKFYLDDSLFVNEKERVGQRAYETGASPLSLNFNSISFEICSTEVGKEATIEVEPKEISVSILGSIFTTSKPSNYSINEVSSPNGSGYKVAGSVNREFGCQTIYRSVTNPLNFFAKTFASLLESNGVRVPSDFAISKVPAEAVAVANSKSKPLPLIVWDLNHFSTNFIAEQLTFAIGGIKEVNWSHERGAKALEGYLSSLGLEDKEFSIVDGSGLSHSNRLSARALTSVLVDVYNNEEIRPDFEASLSIPGISGTLKERMRKFSNGMIRAKTGMLDGVNSIAGYAYRRDGKRFAFAILLNGVDRIEAEEFEEKFVSQLLR